MVKYLLYKIYNMNQYIILNLFILVITAANVKANDAENLKKIIEDVRKCADTNHVTNDELLKLLLSKDEVPPTHEQKCCLACIYDDFGLIKDGKLNKDTAKTFAKALLGDDVNRLTHMKIVIDICHVEVKANETDSCEIGGTLRECVLRQKQKANFLMSRAAENLARYKEKASKNK